MKILFGLLFSLLTFCVAGCGGGGGGETTAAPTLATIKLITSGPAGTTIGAVDATIKMPNGVTVKKTTNTNLPANQADTTVVFGSGAGSNSFVVGNVIDGPPQSLGINFIATGIALGEFTTIRANIAANTSPPLTADDFSVIVNSVADSSGNLLNNVTVSLQITTQ